MSYYTSFGNTLQPFKELLGVTDHSKKFCAQTPSYKSLTFAPSLNESIRLNIVYVAQYICVTKVVTSAHSSARPIVTLAVIFEKLL